VNGEPLLSTVGSIALAILGVIVSAIVSAHVILHKRDVRAAIGWAGLVWLAPFLGSIFYVAFGINRLQRRAARLRRDRTAARCARRAAGDPVARRSCAASSVTSRASR
jgi:hypothetical protein